MSTWDICYLLGCNTSFKTFKSFKAFKLCSLTMMQSNYKSLTERFLENPQVFWNQIMYPSCLWVQWEVFGHISILLGILIHKIVKTLVWFIFNLAYPGTMEGTVSILMAFCIQGLFAQRTKSRKLLERKKLILKFKIHFI